MIEGALSSSADYVAVIDGDLQHDETLLAVMLRALQAGGYDIAVGSRHLEGGDSAGLRSPFRHVLSDGGIWLAQAFLPVRLTDPMSGFFMLPRPLFENLARRLNGQGFKILLDLVLSSPAAASPGGPRADSRTCRRRKQVGRAGGDPVRWAVAGQVLRWFAAAALLLLVGALVIGFPRAILALLRRTTTLGFEAEQAIATAVAMVFNFQLNNVITYRDQRLRGHRLWRGLLLFMFVCGVGGVANVGIAKVLYDQHTTGPSAARRDDRCGLNTRFLDLVWRSR